MSSPYTVRSLHALLGQMIQQGCEDDIVVLSHDEEGNHYSWMMMCEAGYFYDRGEVYTKPRANSQKAVVLWPE